eukprot:CAMPEP_0170478738 /NCGR_PEP_ID=MMETSP0208-20121228/219_1 /TAXON_ID=197538 /ORGANISM="Strombidium inclinatum, Strain S3" /LENGTH=66 /DNA_ID=CAMNT_0010751045 /DNA_START=343 /DNA_END=543 /DNA_ORIENTATION=+
MTGEGIEDSFVNVSRSIVKHIEAEKKEKEAQKLASTKPSEATEKSPGSDSLKLDGQSKKKKKKKCC